MFTPIECVILTCDNCEIPFEDGSGFSIFPDGNSAQERASDSDWEIQDERHYCPGCYIVDDDEKVIIKVKSYYKSEHL